MFLLFLMGLGTASVKAQVRIGGNAAPNASAVLDLNADDTNSGSKGLALPRVALTSNTMLLPGVTQNLTGMMVYNTSTTGTGVNRIGIYYWNGATWVLASLPSASAADSGKFLTFNGISWAPTYLTFARGPYNTTGSYTPWAASASTWTLTFNTTVQLPAISAGYYWRLTNFTSMVQNDMCFITAGNYLLHIRSEVGALIIVPFDATAAQPAQSIFIKCLRPS